MLVTLLWSAKESALKALHEGLRLDTRSMDVSLVDADPPQAEERLYDSCPVSLKAPAPDGWRPLRVRYGSARVFRGWWRLADDMVRTIVSDLSLQ